VVEEVKAHETSTSMVQAAPDEVGAGVDLALKVQVTCPSYCDLRGQTVKIIDKETVIQETKLTEFYGTANETDRLIVKSPTDPGEYTWTALFPAQEKGGVLHQESSAPFSFMVKPHHATSMAVWDVPSPIAFGGEFRIKVGVRCFADCKLTGKEVGIYDHEGPRAGTGVLGDNPWPGTTTLYWAEVKLKSPDTQGYYQWTAKFPKSDLEAPHEESAYTFAFRTVSPPEHVVTVEVVDNDTKTPIEKADVILHPYRNCTDGHGVARVEVPKGEYELYVSACDKQIFQAKVKVDADVSVKAELLVAPVADDGG
jgi:hypothetical protein